MTDQRYNALLDIYFFYTFSNHLETHGGKFNGNFPDYLWYAIICGTLVNVLSIFYNALIDPITVFPYDCLLACVTYTWSRSNKNATINLIGIVPMKAYYLPLGNLLIKLIIRGPSGAVDTVIGIAAGYFYLCMQLNTMPFYNLLSGAYGQVSRRVRNEDTRRVGILTSVASQNRFGGNQAEFIEDSIYDKGYLKAPTKLYQLLGYPLNTSVRTTAFTTTTGDSAGRPGRRTPFQSQSSGGTTTASATSTGTKREDSASGSSTGYSWFSGNNSAFKGKGHRLGS
jgi:Derlin-2/3